MATPAALRLKALDIPFLKMTFVLRENRASSEYVHVMEQTKQLSNKFSNLIPSVSLFRKCKNT
jgi:hypothetical protein